MKKKALARELRFKKKLQKIISIETTILLKNNRPTIAKQALNKEKLETTILISKYKSKICIPILFNKIISNPIYSW